MSSSTSASDPTPSYRRFACVLSGLVAAVALAVSTFLFVVDPQGAHESGDGGPLHLFRDTGNRRGRAHLLQSAQWDSVLIGSSRVALGYDTDDYGFEGGRTANLGLMDTNLWELLRVAEFAVDRAHVPTIVLFVDLHCLASSRRKNFDFDRSDFASEEERGLLEHFDETESELLSFHELGLALSCLENEAAGRRRFGRNGVDLRQLPPDHRYREDTAQHLIRVYLANPGTYLGFEYGSDRIEDLERFVAHARGAGTRVVLAIPPMHALQMECIQQIGLWDDLERMKRDLAGVATRAGLPLVDFAAHHAYALERMPGDDEVGARMQWWTDSSHCTTGLGRIVLERIEAALAGTPADVELFGTLLGEADVERHLDVCRAARNRWRAAQPAEPRWITGVIESDDLLRLLPPRTHD